MRRLEPKLKTDDIGNIDLSLVDAVREYFNSKQHEKSFIKPPKWDTADCGDMLEFTYLENCREKESMLQQQKDMLANSRRLDAANTAKIKKMRKMQEVLRRRFGEVNNFLKECADKKAIADNIVDSEQTLHNKLREDIDKYHTSVEQLEHFYEDLKDTVNEFSPYSNVLNEVVKKSKIFASSKDCTDRCDALMLAQVEINQFENLKVNEIEEMRKTMVKMTNEAALFVLGLKNDLSKLERSYNLARSSALKWEKHLARVKESISNQRLHKFRVWGGVKSLYDLISKPNHHMKKFWNVEEALDFIKTEMELKIAVIKQMKSKGSRGVKVSERNLC